MLVFRRLLLLALPIISIAMLTVCLTTIVPQINNSVDTLRQETKIAQATLLAQIPTNTLTPTATFTPSVSSTPSATFTPSYTPTASYTPSSTPTFTITPTLTSTPTVTLTPSTTPLPTCPSKTNSDTQAFLMPVSTSGEVASIPANTPIVVKNVIDGKPWLYINYKSQDAWIRTENVTLGADAPCTQLLRGSLASSLVSGRQLTNFRIPDDVVVNEDFSVISPGWVYEDKLRPTIQIVGNERLLKYEHGFLHILTNESADKRPIFNTAVAAGFDATYIDNTSYFAIDLRVSADNSYYELRVKRDCGVELYETVSGQPATILARDQAANCKSSVTDYVEVFVLDNQLSVFVNTNRVTTVGLSSSDLLSGVVRFGYNNMGDPAPSQTGIHFMVVLGQKL